MFQRYRLNSELSFFQKIKELDYTLLICIIILSIISLLVMYSTDGGEILYHTKSHFSKLVFFFPMMIFIAFFNIRHWHTFAYVFYFLIILLLLYVSFFGLKASGSQRWMDLYLFVLQPSELMKIGIILCLAKYYHRIKIENVIVICQVFEIDPRRNCHCTPNSDTCVISKTQIVGIVGVRKIYMIARCVRFQWGWGGCVSRMQIPYGVVIRVVIKM